MKIKLCMYVHQFNHIYIYIERILALQGLIYPGFAPYVCTVLVPEPVRRKLVRIWRLFFARSYG